MTSPLVSVIMPAYNAEIYIREAINSVLNQTHSNWELIIINDGSTDKSEEIIKSYSDQRIKLFNQTNKGVSAARNVGLAEMQGEYFSFLDADDLLTPNSISSRMNMFLTNSNIEFIDGHVLIFDSNTKNNLEVYKPSFKGTPYKKLLSISPSCFFGPSWMIKYNPSKRYIFKDGLTHVEDLLFYISISNTGIYDFVEETVYEYRRGNNSAMLNLKMLEKGYFQVYQEILNKYSNAKDFKKKIKSIMFKSYLSKLDFYGACMVLFR